MSDAGEGPCAVPGGPGTAGSPPATGTSGSPPKIDSKTRRSVSMWSLLATRVASAHRYSPETVTGRATVTALANRSHRPGSAGTPAARSAAPNLAATNARSSPGRGAPPPATGTVAPARRGAPAPGTGNPSPGDAAAGTPLSGLIGRGQCREPGRAHGLQVFGVLEYRTGGLVRGGAVEAGRAEHV